MTSDLLTLAIADATTSPTTPSLPIHPALPADIGAFARAYLCAYPPAIGAESHDTAMSEMRQTFDGEYGPLRDDLSFAAGLPPVGAIFVTTHSLWDDIPGPFIIDLFVHASAQGAGLGRALLTSTVTAARSAGDTTLSLRIGEGTSPAAHALYRRFGFRELR